MEHLVEVLYIGIKHFALTPSPFATQILLHVIADMSEDSIIPANFDPCLWYRCYWRFIIRCRTWTCACWILKSYSSKSKVRGNTVLQSYICTCNRTTCFPLAKLHLWFTMCPSKRWHCIRAIILFFFFSRQIFCFEQWYLSSCMFHHKPEGSKSTSSAMIKLPTFPYHTSKSIKMNMHFFIWMNQIIMYVHVLMTMLFDSDVTIHHCPTRAKVATDHGAWWKMKTISEPH